ncbi:hypothetical protein DL98DRAFT_537093 [Cadophora sp. DSE1049]|nr:hypothetical protein DL98DRAFT_537093 [Cadophora sp. DSE1049]
MNASNHVSMQLTHQLNSQNYQAGMELNFSSNSTEAASTTTLALLLQLPDFLQNLVLQLGDDLDTFTCFSRLPVEIRLVIWRLTFPRGRHVNFDREINSSFYHWWGSDADTSRNLGIETHCPLPTVFYVNQESRQESLKHYMVMPRVSATYPPEFIGFSSKTPRTVTFRPLFFCPAVDTAFITMSTLNDRKSTNWLTEVRNQSLKLFDSIGCLEIRDWSMDANEVEIFLGPDSSHPFITMDLFHSCLLQFTGTKALKFVLMNVRSLHCMVPDLFLDTGRKKAADELVEVFGIWEQWKGKLPTISVEPWNKFWE